MDDNASVMPSPEFLREKILVKAKKLPPGKTENDDFVSIGDDDDDDDDESLTQINNVDGSKSIKHKNASKVWTR